MSEEEPGAAAPPEQPAPPPPLPPVEERSPFWGYGDLLLFAGLAVPAMLAGMGLVKACEYFARVHPSRAADALAMQFTGYLFLFLVLLMIFRMQYERPLWHSLGWVPIPLPPTWIAISGWLTAFAVAGVAYLIRTPVTSNPLTELMQDRPSMILIGIFGVTLGPVSEELVFRGFLQPLVVRSLGAPIGIVLAAIPFGLLHYSEYGNSWRHAVLISGAGAAFGWMRHATGSTKASALMHAAYNALFFAALWSSKR